MSNNVNYDQFFVKNKLKILDRQLSSKITEKWLNNVFKWCHMSDTRHGMNFFSEYFYYHIQQLQLVVKTKFKGLNRPEKRLNDVLKWRHMYNTGHSIQKKFSEYFTYHISNNFNYDQLAVKTKFKGLKLQ